MIPSNKAVLLGATTKKNWWMLQANVERLPTRCSQCGPRFRLMDSHDRKPQTGPRWGQPVTQHKHAQDVHQTMSILVHSRPFCIKHPPTLEGPKWNGGFLKWGYIPQNGWFAKDNPIKMDDEQGYPHFRKPPTGTTGKTGQHYILLNYGWSQIPSRTCPV